MIKAVIIDDEKWSRNVIRSFGKWKELGIIIVGEAEDGEEGLKLIEKFKPNIIITDMNMPIIDGVGLLQGLNHKASDTKIIVISGFDDFDYMKQAIRSKAIEYLLKPVDAGELNRILKQCIQEICLDHKTDSLLVYERIEKQVIEYVINRRNLLEILLAEKDMDQIQLVFQEMSLYLKKLQGDEVVVTRMVEDTMRLLVRESLILPVQDHETICVMYRELNNEVVKGLFIETYFMKLTQLFKEGIRCHLKMIEGLNQPISVLVKGYIDEAYRENISLEKIAKHFFVSKEYLSGAFKNKYKVNMSQYILQLKMTDAKKLIEEGVSYNQIAQRVGYQDLSYFYKVFKKYYGCPPGDYKNKMEG